MSVRRNTISTIIDVDRDFLRSWPIPEASGSKRSRGDVVVVGGSRRTPGAAQLAGLAALRVGAGRLTLAVGASVATELAVAVPEAGIVGLRESRSGRIVGRSVAALRPDLRGADAVLVGPGLDDIGETRKLLQRMLRLIGRTPVVLDAYALGALAGLPRARLWGRGILTPNLTEAGILLGHEVDDLDADSSILAQRFAATVSCFGTVASPDGRIFHVPDGGAGLGTSGSGDVLAGAITGLLARGCDPVQAAVWGTYVHSRAGRALAHNVAAVGFLASEIVVQLPHALSLL